MVKKKKTSVNKKGKYRKYPHEIELAIQKALNLYKLNMLSQAEAIYTNILSKYPEHPQANHLYGLILFNRKNHAGAILYIKNAIKAEPANAEYIHNLGIVYKDSGNLDEAKRMFRLSLKANANYYSAFNSLGSIFMLEGNYKDAKTQFKRAIKLNPAYLDAIYNLAQSYLSLKDYRHAEEQLLILQKHSPDDPEINKALYSSYVDSGNYKAAITLILKAINKAPNDALMIYKLAQIYEKQSQLQEAEKQIDTACILDGKNPKYNWLRAVVYRRLGRIKEASEVLGSIKMPTGDNVLDQNIYFELGRMLDKRGEYDAAFTNFNLANQTQLESLDKKLIKKDRFLKHIDKVHTNLSGEWVSGWNVCEGSSDDKLVFMVAFPRSGTTLLDQLLDGHSKIQVMEEEPILGNIISQIVAKGHDYPACIQSLSCKEINKYRRYYFKEAEKYIKLKPDSTLIDKLPLNIIEIQLIHRLFPSAKIILSLRHPYDVCLSNYMQHFDLNDAMANFLTLEDTAKTYRKTMQLWQKYVEVLPISYQSVRYEDLVDDTETQAKALINFLGFEWEEAILDHAKHAKTRKINTPSYQQVTQPIYNSSRYRWKNYESHLNIISDDLKELIESFGYAI